MFNKITTLAIFGLLALIGARAQALSAEQRQFNPPNTQIPGMTINNDEVGRYCVLGQKDPPKGYACFTLLGDIKARMSEHKNLNGFMTLAGETFVLIDNGAVQSFATDIDHVTVTPAKQAHCMDLVVHRNKGLGYQNSDITSSRCPGATAFHLADKWTIP